MIPIIYNQSLAIFKKRLTCFLYIFILSFFVALPSCAADEIFTNLKGIEKVIHDILHESFQQIETYDIRSFVYSSQKADVEYQWIIEKEIQNVAKAHGFESIYKKDIQNEKASVRLNYLPVFLKIEYKEKNNQELERHISANIFVQIFNNNDQVLFSSSIEKSFTDSINKKDLEIVEDDHFKFTKVMNSNENFLKKLIEPLMITAITGSIIYSFYTFRSR